MKNSNKEKGNALQIILIAIAIFIILGTVFSRPIFNYLSNPEQRLKDAKESIRKNNKANKETIKFIEQDIKKNNSIAESKENLTNDVKGKTTEQLSIRKNNETQKKEGIYDLVSYKNIKYGFQFDYPRIMKIIENKNGNILEIRDSINKKIFSITDISKKFDTENNEVLFYTNHLKSKKCIEDFYGIFVAKTSFGDAFESTDHYNIFTNKNMGISINFDRYDYEESWGGEGPKPEFEIKEEERKRFLENWILKTFKFTGNIKSVEFKCK